MDAICIYSHFFWGFYVINFFIFDKFCFIEKGKLRHANVSPEPGETKDIRSFKVSYLFWHCTLYSFGRKICL